MINKRTIQRILFYIILLIIIYVSSLPPSYDYDEVTYSWIFYYTRDGEKITDTIYGGEIVECDELCVDFDDSLILLHLNRFEKDLKRGATDRNKVIERESFNSTIISKNKVEMNLTYNLYSELYETTMLHLKLIVELKK